MSSHDRFQRFRQRVKALKYEHSEAYRRRGERPMEPGAELTKARALLIQARTLVDPRYHRQLETAREVYSKAAASVRKKSYDANLQPGYVLNALGHITLRPAFRVGQRTSRGVVEHVGEYSDFDGWLYGVRNERGVFDRVWESTLVHPAQRDLASTARKAGLHVGRLRKKAKIAHARAKHHYAIGKEKISRAAAKAKTAHAHAKHHYAIGKEKTKVAHAKAKVHYHSAKTKLAHAHRKIKAARHAYATARDPARVPERPQGKGIDWLYGAKTSNLLVTVTQEPDGLYYVWVREGLGEKPFWTYAFKTRQQALMQMRQTAGYARRRVRGRLVPARDASRRMASRSRFRCRSV